MAILESFDTSSWQGSPTPQVASAIDALEAGKVVYLPQLHFSLSDAELQILSPVCLDGKSKNVSYRPDSGALGHSGYQGEQRDQLLAIMRRYYEQASSLLQMLCPEYSGHLRPGFTSFRPIEIAGRTASPRQDDTRLHTDAFRTRPMQGLRILRVFSNVNPQAPRVWRVGEPFEQAAAKFVPQIGRPLPGSARLLSLLGLVKGRRTEYDHLMLGIHDRMKSDDHYQSQVSQEKIDFPPGATWICYTDWVAHAAMSGQFAFEQTFYLPVDAMKDINRSPLRVLEKLTGRPLL
jgi:hypothetical protein